MITLKTWNSFSQQKRLRAVKLIYSNTSEWYQLHMAEEWHHKLDAEHRIILSSIFEQNEGERKYYVVKTETVL